MTTVRRRFSDLSNVTKPGASVTMFGRPEFIDPDAVPEAVARAVCKTSVTKEAALDLFQLALNMARQAPGGRPHYGQINGILSLTQHGLLSQPQFSAAVKAEPKKGPELK